VAKRSVYEIVECYQKPDLTLSEGERLEFPVLADHAAARIAALREISDTDLEAFPASAVRIAHSFFHLHARNPADLVDIVYTAEAAHKHVHAFGSKWSFSDCAITSDYFVDMSHLVRPIQTVQKAIKVGDPALAFHVEAGVNLNSLYLTLGGFVDPTTGLPRPLAVQIMGGASGQTLAGPSLLGHMVGTSRRRRSTPTRLGAIQTPNNRLTFASVSLARSRREGGATRATDSAPVLADGLFPRVAVPR
jgi:hypothetical protein